ncbi:transposable element Tcb1 transposase [Trichonephila clavipes]|uniref:Transposable element Tcb1 transposase n=1 Tax=Trichonephila clavipes TaxID=2585209 RepID=A0A8X6RZN3_TRICX|nr:transposable element Tcb1 transposase [Trichonephila clavipes]
MARIVRHNDESVREGYIGNGGKEVKLFTSALKAFQCNNRIVMAQRKHLDGFLRGRIIGRLECGRTQLEVSEVAPKLQRRMRTGIYIWQLLPKETDGAQHQTSLVSPLQLPVRQFQSKPCKDAYATLVYMLVGLFSLQFDSRRTLIWRAPGTRYHQENTIERHRYGGAGWLVWGGIILGSRTDLHVQSVRITGHIYQDVILEQHVRLFRGSMGAEFLFMDDNARTHIANIVD